MSLKLLSGLLVTGILGAFLTASVCFAEDELPEAGAQRISRTDTTGRPLPGEPRRFNIQTSPVALVFGRYNASLEAGIGRSFSFGFKGTNYPRATLSDGFDTTTGYEVGGRATWYATSDRFTDGLIFRAGGYYKNTETRHDFADAMGDLLVRTFTFGLASSSGVTVDVTKGPAFEFMGGYQMVLASGINFDWNAGLTTYQQYSKVVNLTNGSSEVYESKSWHVRPVFEFNVGYAF
jgi:hypothetical protein